MKRLTKMIAVMAVMIAGLAGCSNTKLADAFDEEQVEQAAENVVNQLVSGEYEAVVSEMSSEMKEAVTAEALAANMEAMNAQTGAFQEYKSTAAVGQAGADGADIAVVVVVAAFEKCNVTYTISYNTDMELIGLWMK